MQYTPAGDGFIIGMRENNEHMAKLPYISQGHRKIRDDKKACHPEERDDEKNNQENYYRFFPAFSIGSPPDEETSPWHDGSPGSVHHFRAVRTAMEWSALCDAYIQYTAGRWTGWAPQRPDGTPAQGDSEEDQGNTDAKERCSTPGYGRCLKQPGEQEIQCDADPLQSDQDAHGATILDWCFFSGRPGSLLDRADHFWNLPNQASGQEYPGCSRVGIDQWEQRSPPFINCRQEPSF